MALGDGVVTCAFRMRISLSLKRGRETHLVFPSPLRFPGIEATGFRNVIGFNSSLKGGACLRVAGNRQELNYCALQSCHWVQRARLSRTCKSVSHTDTDA